MSGRSLILASASPRRSELLNTLGVTFDCYPAHINESTLAGESPAIYVERMAAEKARAVVEHFPAPGFFVLAADTTVVIDNDVLGKPVDSAHALDMLLRLSGRIHTVMTAVCLCSAEGLQRELVVTEVEFASLNRATYEAYLLTDEPWDKAGAYGIQGLGGALVRSISGSYSNVVGLPLCETRQLLADNGIATFLDPLPQSN